MRIRNPPTFIMSTSLIMSLIMTLLVFQCTGATSQPTKTTYGTISHRRDGRGVLAHERRALS